MSFGQYETLLVSERDGFVSVTLNRPKARNAMSLTMVHELLSLCGILKEEATRYRAVVMRGAEGHFCAGGDIKDMAQARAEAMAGQGESDPYVDLNRVFGELINEVQMLPQVVVAVLEGAVLGGGFGLACVSDVAIALQDAKLGMPETTLGVVPAQIAPFVVQRMGLTEARRLALLGIRINGIDAHRLGIVHEVASNSDELESKLAEVLAGIRRCAPGANAVTKALMLSVSTRSITEILDDAARAFSEAVRGPEGLEGTMAFIEKRKPAWVSEGGQ